MFVYAHAYAHSVLCGGLRTASVSQYIASPTKVLGPDLRSAGWVVSAFTCSSLFADLVESDMCSESGGKAQKVTQFPKMSFLVSAIPVPSSLYFKWEIGIRGLNLNLPHISCSFFPVVSSKFDELIPFVSHPSCRSASCSCVSSPDIP